MSETILSVRNELQAHAPKNTALVRIGVAALYSPHHKNEAQEATAVTQSQSAATTPDARVSPSPDAFHLLRYFSIASGIAILLATIVITWAYYREEVADQIQATETRNVMLAQTFANTIWPQYSAHLSQPFVSAVHTRSDPNTRKLHDTLRSMSRRVPVIKIKMYNPSGTAIYSSVLDEIGEDKSANPAFRVARSGKAVSELTHRGSMSASEGRIENVDVISTYIPIAQNGDHAQAVFELYSDVTDAVVKIERKMLQLIAGLVAIFVLLYGILLLIVRHADGILQRQYRELTRSEEHRRIKNAELESEIERRKDVELALRKSEDEAATANRAKTEFLSNMSHELRTPMNAILGFAQLLESEPTAPLSAIQQSFVEQILKAGRHLLDLINEVLDLARVESGKMTLSVEPVALSSIMNECLPLIQNMAREREISITPLPEESRLRVMADYMRLKQALLNLLSNAVKYNRPGGKVTVEAAGTDNGRVRVNVTDTGLGIPESMHGELFRPFHRLGLDASEVEGTGIGLALTRSLISAMGGAIGFRSVWGAGSTFWIELPVAPEQLARAKEVSDSVEVLGRGSGTAAQHSVLYIEDNPANVLLMEQIARRLCVRFLTAPNAELGIALAASEKPDLIVMDINLPQMNGYEALARLARNRETASIPVMALTANAMHKDIERGLAAGFVRYLTKPFQVPHMESTIRQILDEKQ